jgi:hypothetical protein
MPAHTAKPLWVEFGEDPFPPAYESKSGFPQDRIKESGPGSEILRRIHVEALRGHMESFYETASTVDVLPCFKSSKCRNAASSGDRCGHRASALS